MKNVLIICLLFIAIAIAADYEFNNKSCFIKINSENLKYSFSDSCPKMKKDSSGFPSNVFFLNCTRGSDLNSKVKGIDIYFFDEKISVHAYNEKKQEIPSYKTTNFFEDLDNRKLIMCNIFSLMEYEKK